MPTNRYITEAPFDEARKTNRRICRWCGGPLPRRRRSFCSDECVEQYCIRSGMFLNSRVRDRDQGLCAVCGLDCVALYLETQRYGKKIGWRSYLERVGMARWASRSHNRFWNIHHIVPVKDGGGACGLDNVVTLCIVCHKNVHAGKIDLKEALKTPPNPRKRELPAAQQYQKEE